MSACREEKEAYRIPGMRKLPLLVLLFLGCSSAPPVVVVPPAPGVENCDAAEKKLLDLQCKDRRGRLIGGPTLRGQTWSQVCHDNTNNGVDMETTCIVQAVDCEGVEQCR